MEVEIRPEPTPDEREAIVRALAELGGHADQRSAWWDAGLHDAVDGEQDERELG
jgi:hypothetical protein